MIKLRLYKAFGLLLLGLLFQGLMAQNIKTNSVLLIKTYNNNGHPEKAEQIIQQANEDTKSSKVFMLAKAENFYATGNFKQAANIYKQLNIKSNKIANYELAKCYAQLNRPDLAVEYLKKHVASKNRLMQRTIKSDKAFYTIDASDEWIEFWQTEHYSKYDLMLEDAWFDYESGKYEQVLEQVSKINNVRKSLVDAYYLKSLAYLKVNEPNNALVAVNTAIEKRSNNASYYALKAQTEIELNKGKKALKSITKALSIDSVNIDFYFIRAKAYFAANKLESAKHDLSALMELIPNFKVNKLAGEILFEANEYQEALKAYNKCVELEKYNAEIYIARAQVYAQIYGYEYAEKDYTMALDFQPYNGEIYFKRGLARKAQNKSEQACQDFKRAFKYKYMQADTEIRSYCQGR